MRVVACSYWLSALMMRPENDIDIVWLARDAVDFRKGINGLSVLVEEQ